LEVETNGVGGIALRMPEGTPGETIFVVDDDPAVRDLFAVLFSRQGYEVVGFADGAGMIAAIGSHRPACIILDVHIPGKSGIDILKELNGKDHPTPVIIISGKGDIAMAVDAIKSGALDFIEKPFRGSDVVQRVQEAIEADRRRKATAAQSKRTSFHFPGREPLTAREQEVLSQFVTGATNKEAGRQLGISHRTIEIHRARIMEKLGARGAADMIRIAISENRSN
jgi:FixJ family two-component response regulator